MDANNLITMLKKWRRSDVTRGTGDLATALGAVQAKTRVLAFSDDLLFPPEVCEAESAMIPSSEFRRIDSLWAHFAMMCFDDDDRAAIDQNIAELLSTPA